MVAKSNLVDIIPTLSPAWYVSFEIYPFSTGDWLSVVHFKIGRYTYDGLDVLLHGARLYIYNRVNGHFSHTYVTKPLTMNEYTRVEISQMSDANMNASSVLYTIKLDGNQVYQVVNRDARYFPDVKVYKGNPWRNPALAFIKNFVYKNLPNGGKSSVI